MTGAGLWMLKVPKGGGLIPFALGVLGRSMIGRKPDPYHAGICGKQIFGPCLDLLDLVEG